MKVVEASTQESGEKRESERERERERESGGKEKKEQKTREKDVKRYRDRFSSDEPAVSLFANNDQRLIIAAPDRGSVV